MIILDNSAYKIIGEKFVKAYLERGFGQFSKSDIEILLFRFIKENIDNASNYELSNFLKISETRVKNLELNASLRYGEINDERHIEILFDIFKRFLEKGKALSDNEKQITFFLEKEIEKRELQHALKSRGYVPAEYGINNEIIKVDPEKFLILMSEIFNEFGNKGELYKSLKENQKLNEKYEKEFQEIIDKSTSTGEKFKKLFAYISDCIFESQDKVENLTKIYDIAKSLLKVFNK